MIKNTNKPLFNIKSYYPIFMRLFPSQMKLLISAAIFICSLSLIGQVENSDMSVNGIINDAESHTSIQYITVTVQDIETKNIVSVITTKSGEFELIIPAGKYYFTTSSLSFVSFSIEVLKIQQDLDMGIIELTQKVEELIEVEVVAKNSLMDYKSDKKVYNASKDIANAGGNAITVLENTPSVRVDDEGNITVRGNSARVLVNGIPYGGQETNADILSLIPSNSINKVEIITRSAKYDAEGGSILNIVLKKGADEGYNGSIEAHAAIPDNLGVSTFLNYKTPKINLFSTASFNNRVRIKETDIEQIFLNNIQQPHANFDENRKDNKQRSGLLLNLGSDFYLNEKNTLTTSLLYSSASKNYDSKLILNDYDPIDVISRSSIRDVDENTNEGFIEAYANFTTKFNNDGHQLSMLLNYDNNTSKNDTYITNTETYPGSNGYNQRSLHDQYLNNYYLNIDYSLPLKNNSLLDIGHKSSFRIYSNDFIVSNLDENNVNSVAIDDFFNKINYDENIYAFWANLKKEYENFSYSFGLRSEITYTTINDHKEDRTISNNYSDFFPDALLTYTFKNDSYVSFNYNRYISRPTIKELNPFNSFTDERFILVGNPYLDPYYSNSFMIEYHRDFEKLSFNSAIYYTNSIDKIRQTIQKTEFQTINGNDIFSRIPLNNGDYSATELEVEVTYSPTKKIRFYGLLNPNYTVLSNSKDNLYDYTDIIWIGRINGLLRLTNSFRLQLSYNYQSPIKTAITEFGTYQYAALTLSKDLFKGKSTLNFNINDLFNSKEATYKSLEANTISKLNFNYDTQYLLSFSYRFNNANKRNSKNRVKDADKNVFEIDQ